MHRLKTALVGALTLFCAVFIAAQTVLVPDSRAPDDILARALVVSRVAGRRSKRERRDRRRQRWARRRRIRNQRKELRNKRRGSKAYKRRQREKRKQADAARRQARKAEIFAELTAQRTENKAKRPTAKYETAEQRQQRLSEGTSAAHTPAADITTSNDEAVQAALNLAKSKEDAAAQAQEQQPATEIAALEREASELSEPSPADTPADLGATQPDPIPPPSAPGGDDFIYASSDERQAHAQQSAEIIQESRDAEQRRQDHESRDSGRQAKNDDSQAMEDVGGSGGGGYAGPGLVGQENTDQDMFSFENKSPAAAEPEAAPDLIDDYNKDDAASDLGRGFAEEDRSAADEIDDSQVDVNYFDDAETQRQTDLQSSEDAAGDLGRGFTDVDRAAADGQDFDANYTDDRQQEQALLADDDAASGVLGDSRSLSDEDRADAADQDFDLDYSDDEQPTREEIISGIAARDEDKRVERLNTATTQLGLEPVAIGDGRSFLLNPGQKEEYEAEKARQDNARAAYAELSPADQEQLDKYLDDPDTHFARLLMIASAVSVPVDDLKYLRKNPTPLDGVPDTEFLVNATPAGIETTVRSTTDVIGELDQLNQPNDAQLQEREWLDVVDRGNEAFEAREADEAFGDAVLDEARKQGLSDSQAQEILNMVEGYRKEGADEDLKSLANQGIEGANWLADLIANQPAQIRDALAEPEEPETYETARARQDDARATYAELSPADQQQLDKYLDDPDTHYARLLMVSSAVGVPVEDLKYLRKSPSPSGGVADTEYLVNGQESDFDGTSESSAEGERIDVPDIPKFPVDESARGFDPLLEIVTLGQAQTPTFDSHRAIADLRKENPNLTVEEAAAAVNALREQPQRVAEPAAELLMAVAPGVSTLQHYDEGRYLAGTAWLGFDAATVFVPAGGAAARVARAGGSASDVARTGARAAFGLGVATPDDILRTVGDNIETSAGYVANSRYIPLGTAESGFHTRKIPLNEITSRIPDNIAPTPREKEQLAWQIRANALAESTSTGQAARVELPDGSTLVYHESRHGIPGTVVHGSPSTQLAQSEITVGPDGLYVAQDAHGRFVGQSAGGFVDPYNPSTIHLFDEPSLAGQIDDSYKSYRGTLEGERVVQPGTVIQQRPIGYTTDSWVQATKRGELEGAASNLTGGQRMQVPDELPAGGLPGESLPSAGQDVLIVGSKEVSTGEITAMKLGTPAENFQDIAAALTGDRGSRLRGWHIEDSGLAVPADDIAAFRRRSGLDEAAAPADEVIEAEKADDVLRRAERRDLIQHEESRAAASGQVGQAFRQGVDEYGDTYGDDSYSRPASSRPSPSGPTSSRPSPVPSQPAPSPSRPTSSRPSPTPSRPSRPSPSAPSPSGPTPTPSAPSPSGPTPTPSRPSPSRPSPSGPTPTPSAPSPSGPTPTPSRPSPSRPSPSGPTPTPSAPSPSGPTPTPSRPSPSRPSPSGPTPTPSAPSPSGPTPTPSAPSPSGPTPTPSAPSPSGPTPTPSRPSPSRPSPSGPTPTPSAPSPSGPTPTPSRPSPSRPSPTPSRPITRTVLDLPVERESQREAERGRYPNEVQWIAGPDGRTEFTYDIGTEDISTREVERSDQEPHETLRVSLYSPHLPSERTVDLPGDFGFTVNRSGLRVVADRDLGDSGTRTPVDSDPGTPEFSTENVEAEAPTPQPQLVRPKSTLKRRAPQRTEQASSPSDNAATHSDQVRERLRVVEERRRTPRSGTSGSNQPLGGKPRKASSGRRNRRDWFLRGRERRG